MPVGVAADSRIDLVDVTLSFGGAPLFARLSLGVPPGEFFCLLGPSGAGKSTLLRAVAGLLRPDAGSVRRNGGAALMAQDDALMPWARPVPNVVVGDMLRGAHPDLAKARALLKAVGLDERSERPGEMSGGMRKRVALARLLYEDRPVALLDEPFASLDAITRRGVQALTRRLLVGRTVMLVTHDPAEAMMLADRVAVLAGNPARLVLDEMLPKAPLGSVRDPYDAALRPLHERILRALDEAMPA
jgi:putative hydroxymethylpyrimidine transport system ATP-binding protein